MQSFWAFKTVAVLPFLLLLAIAAASGAVQPAPAAYTAKEIASYRLTPQVFQRFEQASRLVADAIRQDPKLADNPLFTRDVAVLDDVVVAATTLDGRLRDEPALAAALRKSGISDREYTTFALALFAARLAHGFVQSGAMRFVPEGVAKDNVAFVDTHRDAVMAVLRSLGLEEP
jgi:hypothetical protein